MNKRHFGNACFDGFDGFENLKNTKVRCRVFAIHRRRARRWFHEHYLHQNFGKLIRPQICNFQSKGAVWGRRLHYCVPLWKMDLPVAWETWIRWLFLPFSRKGWLWFQKAAFTFSAWHSGSEMRHAASPSHIQGSSSVLYIAICQGRCLLWGCKTIERKLGGPKQTTRTGFVKPDGLQHIRARLCAHGTWAALWGCAWHQAEIRHIHPISLWQHQRGVVVRLLWVSGLHLWKMFFRSWVRKQVLCFKKVQQKTHVLATKAARQESKRRPPWRRQVLYWKAFRLEGIWCWERTVLGW